LGNGNTWLPAAGALASATNFHQGVEQNPVLSGAYTISRAGAVVHFKARLPGPQYDLMGNAQSTPLATCTNTVNGWAQEVEENYSVCIRPIIYTQADTPDGYEALPEQVALPGDDHHAQFDLGQILRPHLAPEWPSDGSGSAHLHTTSARPYYVEYYERFGSPAANKVIKRFGSPAAPKLACLMGYQRHRHTDFHTFLNAVSATTPGTHCFLTWRNRQAPRYVTTGEEHYLSWYYWDMLAAPASLTLQARLTHTALDGTDPVTTAWTDRYTATVGTHIVRGRISSWRAGYDQCAMAALLPADRLAHSYSVRVADVISSTGPKSEEVTFYIAPADHNERYIQFINSFGMPESLRTVGAWSETYEPSFMALLRHLRMDDLVDKLAAATSSEPNGGQHYLNLVSGAAPRSEHFALLDLLGAPRYGIRVKTSGPDGNGWRPMRLIKGESIPVAQIGGQDENLHILALQLAVDDPQPFRTMTPTLYASPYVMAAEDDDYSEIPPEEE
jgi:hypothetical protein